MIDLQMYLEHTLRSVIQTWKDKGVDAVSFLVCANEAYQYRGCSNVTEFSVSYHTEQESAGCGELSEERWNYAFWSQNETPVFTAGSDSDSRSGVFLVHRGGDPKGQPQRRSGFVFYSHETARHYGINPLKRQPRAEIRTGGLRCRDSEKANNPAARETAAQSSPSAARGTSGTRNIYAFGWRTAIRILSLQRIILRSAPTPKAPGSFHSAMRLRNRWSLSDAAAQHAAMTR